MAADIVAGCTLNSTTEPQVGMKILVIETEATADDADYFDVANVTGVTGVSAILYAIATQDIVGTPVIDPMKIAGTVLTIGGSTDNKARTVLVYCT